MLQKRIIISPSLVKVISRNRVRPGQAYGNQNSGPYIFLLGFLGDVYYGDDYAMSNKEYRDIPFVLFFYKRGRARIDNSHFFFLLKDKGSNYLPFCRHPFPLRPFPTF
jgi:hypothetical protein